jgi:hypothetical protein
MPWRTARGSPKKSSEWLSIYADVLVGLHDLFYPGQGELMVLEELHIFGHLIDFLLDFLELRVKVFEVVLELHDFLVSLLFLHFERDFAFVKHIIYQLRPSILLYQAFRLSFKHNISHIRKDGERRVPSCSLKRLLDQPHDVLIPLDLLQVEPL